MTLAELIAKAQAVNSQISTAWIPLKSDGRDIDIDLSLIEDKEGYAVNVRITHTESCTESFGLNMDWTWTEQELKWTERTEMELTWQDIKRIIKIADDMIREYPHDTLVAMGEQEYHEEVLRRYNNIK